MNFGILNELCVGNFIFLLVSFMPYDIFFFVNLHWCLNLLQTSENMYGPESSICCCMLLLESFISLDNNKLRSHKICEC